MNIVISRSDTINTSRIGDNIAVSGWVNKRRDHGGVIFVDLRDYNGIVQLVFRPEDSCFKDAESLRSEHVIEVQGEVCARPEGTVNKDLNSGEIEIIVHKLDIINKSKPLPFPINSEIDVSEEVRLKYRFLDLRRGETQDRIRFRSQLSYETHKYLNENNFTEVETPVLTKATPEGARDYLVPSRTHLGHCFALPQSPQIFKQLLMMSGFENYYQIVKCFRDEDLRADRQPEFTQIDLEMAFVEQKQVMQLVEGLCRHLFKNLKGIEFPKSLTVLSYEEAMTTYGCDRPDLRNPLRLTDISDIFKNSGFSLFADSANDSLSRVAAMLVKDGASLSRKQLDYYTDIVCKAGAKGLAYMKINDINDLENGVKSPLNKFLTPAEIKDILNATNANTGDIIFFGAGRKSLVAHTMSTLRDQLGKDLELIAKDSWELLWVVDFPMFEVEYNNAGKVIKLNPMHHPFTAPKCSLDEFISAPELALSKAYDLVLNGCEIGGGSIRIHQADMQTKVLETIGINPEHAQNAFGHLLNGLDYGCPPHGGFAFGLDRLLMLMTGAKSIRDVIAFPKTQSAACPLTDAPTQVDVEQLQTLNMEFLSDTKI